MSNKKQRNREHDDPKPSIFNSRAFTILGGVLFVALFIAVGIVTVTLLGGDELSEGDPDLPPLPALGQAPDTGRSPNADLLANTSFDDMTPAQRQAIADDAARLFADANVRVSSEQVTALDVARRGGRTRATIQYRYTDDTPGGAWALTRTIVFYCDGPPGTVDTYRVDDTGFEASATYDRRSEDAPPFQRIFPGADWSEPRDLGLRDINGIRVRGVQIHYRPQATSAPIDVEHWYDIETGRLTFYKDVDQDVRLGYFFDWREPPPFEVPAELTTPPPCASLVTGG